MQTQADRIPSKEGYISFKGYKVWYKVVGEKDAPGKLPLLCLHGGPGANHIYLQPLEAMAATGRRVIFYDQLGGGNSDHPSDTQLWTIPLFLEELSEIRRQLGLDSVHLFGQSWGGMLAMEYCLGGAGVASLTLADSLASVEQWMSEANRLRAELPEPARLALKKHEDAGTTNSQEYLDAMMVYYKRYLCRLDPWPEYLLRSFEEIAKFQEVYATMWGPSEFFANGTLKNWDIRGRLGAITAPTLVLSGRYDESTPLVSGELHKRIPGSKWVVFENSAHLPHAEEPERYMRVLDDFLTGVENNRKEN